jgi:hypothetical protein
MEVVQGKEVVVGAALAVTGIWVGFFWYREKVFRDRIKLAVWSTVLATLAIQ